ncbi:MAG TPA: uroporphyrinogen decarboxylase family protein [Chthonomonadales bacterium]|nr:uroporphyrinogen decarboxylase family protein [Chthonomonadales bacterium]
MSYDIGAQALTLQRPERIAHTEYCSNYALVRAVTGLDPARDAEAWRRFYDAWQIDFIWSSDDGPVDWAARGRVTDMGHAEFLEGGVDRRDTVHSPFRSVDDVLAFDAVLEYGLPDFEGLVAHYERSYQSAQAAFPNQVCPGGYYKTIVSGAIQAFGWDMLLEAAVHRREFERVLDSFFELTLHHVRAWARTSVRFFLQHDDMVWAEGPFMHPDIYRGAIFPRYRRLWDAMHEAGKPVLYCSDGDFTLFVDDLAEAGADGFIFEPLTDLDVVVQRYGETKVIMGSKVDCRTLTFGTPDDIRAEIDATLSVAKDCPGFVFAVGNHIPSNVPVENALAYFDHLSRCWRR